MSGNMSDYPSWASVGSKEELEQLLSTLNTSNIHSNDLIKSITLYMSTTNENLDNFFFIMNGILVLLMQVGFACLEAGSIREKNVTNIMLKNYLDSLICSIVFWLTGYGIAFGQGNSYIGWTWLAGINLPDKLWSEWFFQYTFASTASTILSGAVAERSSFFTYLCYSILMSVLKPRPNSKGGIIYPVAVHWTWSDQGWLKQLGFIDYAGGMLIHGVAGSACLVAALIIGPRIGRFEEDDKNALSGHSTALVGIGAIIILVGFCGFNAGTVNHYSKPEDGLIATIIVRNTIMCGAGGALTVLFAGKIGIFESNRWPFAYTINGGISGLVASCAGCDKYSPLESVINGITAGCVYMILHFVILYFRIDDPLDSSPIHMGSGIWSVLALPLIQNGGIITHSIREVSQRLLIQLIGLAAIMLWSVLMSTFLFGILHMFHLFRSPEKEELLGMDVAKHKEPAYSRQGSTTELGIPIQYPYYGTNSIPRVSVLCSTSM